MNPTRSRPTATPPNRPPSLHRRVLSGPLRPPPLPADSLQRLASFSPHSPAGGPWEILFGGRAGPRPISFRKAGAGSIPANAPALQPGSSRAPLTAASFNRGMQRTRGRPHEPFNPRPLLAFPHARPPARSILSVAGQPRDVTCGFLKNRRKSVLSAPSAPSVASFPPRGPFPAPLQGPGFRAFQTGGAWMSHRQISSRRAASRASNASAVSESTSSTARTRPPASNTGTTISERVLLEQAMW
jgi:hypothetical protein